MTADVVAGVASGAAEVAGFCVVPADDWVDAAAAVEAPNTADERALPEPAEAELPPNTEPEVPPNTGKIKNRGN